MRFSQITLTFHSLLFLSAICWVASFHRATLSFLELKGKAARANRAAALSDAIPSSKKSRLFVKVVGAHSINPLFRAQLKKELTFFRGCGAYFNETGPDSAIVIAEGKTSQLLKFITWLKAFGVELSKRKPSFQSPNLIINIDDLHWQEYQGKLKGFLTNHEASELENTSLSRDGELIETINMMDTDESV